MNIILFILLSYRSLGCQSASYMDSTEKANPLIVIEPVTTRELGPYVIKQELDSLNLTCSVYDNSSDAETRYSITWTHPRNSTNRNHIMTQSSGNSASLMIAQLEPRDEGRYACDAHPLDSSLMALNAEVIVNIKNRRECGETMFTCSLSKYGNCIHRRFTCDGYQDCEKGEDEHQEMCGSAPCTNKLPCQDYPGVVRCIPKVWCCNIRLDVNCTTKEPLSCCPNHFQSFMDDRSYYDTLKPHYSDMTFALYTVVGCAMVFMLVVTVLVIAICRVYTRTQWANTLPSRSTHLPENTAAMYDVDMFCEGPPGILVTYNIGQGVQTVGRTVQPPPYSQVVPIPPKEGPPPPYTPLDMPEMEALLSETLGQRMDSDQLSGAVIRPDFTPNRDI